ncbi:MAG: alpha/beta fold hydrolase [Actinomycetota bacterium]
MISQELIEVGGRKVDLRRTGAGEPLVYLHSAMGDFWMPEFLEKVAEHYEVLCPAHPGFGDSTGMEEIADIEDLAFHYADVFDELGLWPLHLVGASLGGWIAAEIAVRWPDKLRSLTLIDAVGIWVDETPLAPMWGVQPEQLVDMLFADRSHPIAQLILSIDIDDPPPEEILLPFINQQAATAKVGWDPYLHNPKLAARLARIKCPTLVIWGEQDGLAPVEYGKRYAALIPGARFEVIPGGHLAILEQPDLVSRLLLRSPSE